MTLRVVFSFTKWQHWLILGVTGSVWGSTGWYLLVLDQYRAVLVDT